MKLSNDERQHAKAVNVAYSWITSWGLRTELDPDGDLVIEGLRVVVDSHDCGFTPDIRLSGVILLGKDTQAVIAEMHRVTVACGRGKPEGFRQLSGTLRASSDDYEAISMRLTPFERTANPPEALLRKYEPVVKREADCAGRRYAQLLKLTGAGPDDLHTIGMCYLVTYLHRHRVLNNEQKDGALLTLFLRQEFRRWAHVTTLHLENVSFSLAGVPVEEIVSNPTSGATIDQQPGGEGEVSYQFDIETPSPEAQPAFATAEAQEQYEKRATKRMVRHRNQIREAREAELEDRLSMLPHDTFVETMTSVIQEERQDIEAREEAERRFKTHMDSCQSCQTAWTAWEEYRAGQRVLRVNGAYHRPKPQPVNLELEAG